MTSISWDVHGSGLWTDAADWTPAQVPGASDTATIAVNNASVTSDGNVTVGSLFLGPESTLTIGANTTFHAEGGQLEQMGGRATVNVDDGATFEIGTDGAAVNFGAFGLTEFSGRNAVANLSIAGNVTFSASSNEFANVVLDNSGLGVYSVTGDGVGSPSLTLDSGNAIEDEGGITNITGLTLTIGAEAEVLSALSTNIPAVLTIATNGNIIVERFGNIAALYGGETIIDTPVDNSGEIAAYDSGTVKIGAGILSTSGFVQIGPFGTLELANGGSITGTVSFASSGNTLRFDAGVGIAGGFSITGMVPSDSIDFAFQPFASGDQAVWQQQSASGGILSLVSSTGSTLTSVTLQGQLSGIDFTAVSDGHGGSLIELTNPVPPAATTADMIMQDGPTYEIYDIGANAILAAYQLQPPASTVEAEVELESSAPFPGLGGFDGSDTSDIMVQYSYNGDLGVLDVSNNNMTGAVEIGQVGPEWQAAGFGNFSSVPGETDMLMRDSNTGAFEVYDISNNAITFATSMGQVGLNWQVAGFGDFSGNASETDMLMRDGNTGAFEVYDISNNAITFATSMGQVGLNWQVAGFGDFSGNANETDMLMRDSNTGAFEVYDISNNTITFATSMGQVGLAWQAAGFADLSGNANETDMLMRNSSTGAFEYYDISHNQITSDGSMGGVGTAWSVLGIAADPPPGAAAAASNQLVQAMASVGASSAAPSSLPAILQPADQQQATLLAGSQV